MSFEREVTLMPALPTSDLSAPDVAFEACDAFAAEETEPGICADCGWLDDEHPTADVPAAA
jgi:hypothetical protein